MAKKRCKYGRTKSGACRKRPKTRRGGLGYSPAQHLARVHGAATTGRNLAKRAGKDRGYCSVAIRGLTHAAEYLGEARQHLIGAADGNAKGLKAEHYDAVNGAELALNQAIDNVIERCVGYDKRMR